MLLFSLPTNHYLDAKIHLIYSTIRIQNASRVLMLLSEFPIKSLGGVSISVDVGIKNIISILLNNVSTSELHMHIHVLVPMYVLSFDVYIILT